MNKKIKAGMYVRFSDGEIGKIAKYEFEKEFINGYCFWLERDPSTGLCCGKDEFKTSHNIIDLIEVGDYVNGYLIDYIDTARRFLRSERPYRENSSWYKDLEEKGKDYNMCLDFKNEDIKSIVTKEMFFNAEYRVEAD